MVAVVKLSYTFVRWFEDDLCHGNDHVRTVTGWFRDMSYYLKGFRVRAIMQYPRLELSAEYRKEAIGEADLGGADPGFVTMVYGFSVFFLCIALAPATCCIRSLAQTSD